MKTNHSFFTIVVCFMLVISLTAGEPEVLVPDFQVNEEGGPLKGTSSNSFITILSNNTILIVWEDGRNRLGNIYRQLYTISGEKIGTNFKLVERDSIRVHQMPIVKVGKNGTFLLIWTGNEEYFFYQLFDNSGQKLGPYYRLEEHRDNTRIQMGSISVDYNMDYFIVWLERSTKSDSSFIYMQKTNNSGIPIGNNVLLKSMRQYGRPKIKLHNNSNFLLTWTDSENYGYNVGSLMAQVFSQQGVPVGEAYSLLRVRGKGFSPASIVDDNNFIIPIQKNNYPGDAGQAEFIFQKISNQGELLTTPLDSVGQEYSTGMRMTPTADNSFLISWESTDYENSKSKIYGREFDYTCQPKGNSFIIYETDFETGPVFDSQVFLNEYLYFSLNEKRDINRTVYLFKFSLNSKKITKEFDVNDFAGYAYQDYPVIKSKRNGDFVIVWQDDRLELKSFNIYGQIYNKDGTAAGPNIKLTGDSLIHTEPDFVFDANENIVLVWKERSYYTLDKIVMQQFNGDLREISEKILLSDANKSLYRYQPQVVNNADGHILGCWLEYEEPEYFLTARVIDMAGRIIGDTLRFPHYPHNPFATIHAVSVNDDGSFVLMGHDKYPFAQIISSSGEMVGGPVIFNKTRFASFNPAANTFHTITFELDNIVLHTLSMDGNEIGEPQIFSNEINGYLSDIFPRFCYDALGNFTVSWISHRKIEFGHPSPGLVAQYFNNQFNPVGQNFEIHHPLYYFVHDQLLCNNKLISIWIDISGKNDPVNTGNVWANIMDLNPLITKINKPDTGVPFSFELLKNYPNPFNPITRITYSLDKPGRTRLDLYDTLGRHVRTMVNAHRTAGTHYVEFDAGDLPSGVYFYRLQTDDHSETRKMLLLR